MSHTIYEVYRKSLVDLLAKWQKRRSRALSPELTDAALMLLNLNLDPLAPALDTLYSDNPRGRTRYDPTVMLRALLLMTMLHQTAIKSFVKDLRTKPRLALIAGFEPHHPLRSALSISSSIASKTAPFNPPALTDTRLLNSANNRLCAIFTKRRPTKNMPAPRFSRAATPSPFISKISCSGGPTSPDLATFFHASKISSSKLPSSLPLSGVCSAI